MWVNIEYKLTNFHSRYLEQINELNNQEGWDNLAGNKENYFKALENSITTVAVDNNDNVLGYIRALTDGYVTLFICELLIVKHKRGEGIGKILIRDLHRKYPYTRIDLLATQKSSTFYEKQNFRVFYGYRK